MLGFPIPRFPFLLVRLAVCPGPRRERSAGGGDTRAGQQLGSHRGGETEGHQGLDEAPATEPPAPDVLDQGSNAGLIQWTLLGLAARRPEAQGGSLVPGAGGRLVAQWPDRRQGRTLAAVLGRETMAGSVLWDVDRRGVVTVTLNRPEVGNAYDGDLILGLHAAMDDAKIADAIVTDWVAARAADAWKAPARSSRRKSARATPRQPRAR